MYIKPSFAFCFRDAFEFGAVKKCPHFTNGSEWFLGLVGGDFVQDPTFKITCDNPLVPTAVSMPSSINMTMVSATIQRSIDRVYILHPAYLLDIH